MCDNEASPLWRGFVLLKRCIIVWVRVFDGLISISGGFMVS